MTVIEEFEEVKPDVSPSIPSIHNQLNTIDKTLSKVFSGLRSSNKMLVGGVAFRPLEDKVDEGVSYGFLKDLESRLRSQQEVISLIFDELTYLAYSFQIPIKESEEG